MQQPNSTSFKFADNNNFNNSINKTTKKNQNLPKSYFNDSKHENEIKNFKNKANTGYSIPLSKISSYFSSTISKSGLISNNDKKKQIMTNLSTTRKSNKLNKIYNLNAQTYHQNYEETKIINKSILQNMDEAGTDESDEIKQLLFECRDERMIILIKSKSL